MSTKWDEDLSRAVDAAVDAYSKYLGECDLDEDPLAQPFLRMLVLCMLCRRAANVIIEECWSRNDIEERGVDEIRKAFEAEIDDDYSGIFSDWTIDISGE